MEKHDAVRRDVAIGALASLTEARTPYAVQRNLDQIATGKYKDIDLIAPRGSVALIQEAFLARNDVVGAYLKKALSRSQISVALSCATPQSVVIDIDHQVTLTEDAPFRGRIGRLLSRSVVFSDLTMRQLDFEGAKITVLDPPSELVLLKIHAHRKPKKAYIARILELEASGLSDRNISTKLDPRLYNLLRRYGLFLRAFPGWVAARLQKPRPERFTWSNYNGRSKPSKKKEGE